MYNTDDRRKFSVIFPNVKGSALKRPVDDCLWCTEYAKRALFLNMGDIYNISPRKLGKIQAVGDTSVYQCFKFFEENSVNVQENLFNPGLIANQEEIQPNVNKFFIAVCTVIVIIGLFIIVR